MALPTTLALTRLLPTLKPLPKSLIDTADSLLALSRSRVSHLKSEEEIARAHACAELACNRLRVKLRLPPIKQGLAPANAKVYKKLYTFLEQRLSEDVQRLITTPGKRKREELQDVTPTKRQRQTPSTITAPSKTPASFAGKTKSVTKQPQPNSDEAPSYVLSTIRTLSKAFKIPEVTPHVYTGMCIAMKLSSLWPRPSIEEATAEDLEITDDMFEENIIALTIALYLMVLTRMRRGKMTSKLFKAISTKAAAILGKLDTGGEAGNSEIWTDDVADIWTANVQKWVKTIVKEGYAIGQPWWNSVPEEIFDLTTDDVENANASARKADNTDTGLSNGHAELDDNDTFRKKTELDLAPDPEDILLPGLGTIMQDAVDWTSTERKRDYKDWRDSILEKFQLFEGNITKP